jgi:hypothetical protein
VAACSPGRVAVGKLPSGGGSSLLSGGWAAVATPHPPSGDGGGGEMHGKVFSFFFLYAFFLKKIPKFFLDAFCTPSFFRFECKKFFYPTFVFSICFSKFSLLNIFSTKIFYQSKISHEIFF